MAVGKLVDSNLALTATITGGVTSAAPLDLSALKDEKDYVGTPCRFPDCTDLTKTQFFVALAEPRLVSLVVLLFHTMSLSAKCRVRVSSQDPAGPITVWDVDTGWADVFPSIYDPADLEWGVDNWWNGTLSQAELDLMPRHGWIPIAETVGWAMLIEFDDRTNVAGFFDLGGLTIASGFSSAINFARGRDIAVNPRDLVDEAPSGRLFSEERTPRRQLSVSYDMLSDAEARRWLDAALRARTTRTVLFVPDADDPASMAREAFPATFKTLPGPKFTYPGLNQVAGVLQEILA